jgi:DNA repair protein RadC
MTYETIVTKESDRPVIIDGTIEIYRYVSNYYKSREQGQVILMTLGESFHLKNVYLMHVGNVTEKTLDIKDICLKAITDKAKYIVICHIRPNSSDMLRPTGEDYSIAEKIFRAVKLIDTKVLYNVIIGDTGYTEIKNDHNDDEEMKQ